MQPQATNTAELDAAIKEINRTFGLPSYEAFDFAWIAVIKIANMLPGSKEHVRLLELGERLSDDAIRYILHREEVDTLLELKPPLETILSFSHERLDAERTRRELEQVRLCRDSNPRVALRNLVEVLKRIRNRRAHGFKTPEGPRDDEILGAAVWLVRLLGLSAAEALGAR
jgi:hypothetical protein